MIEHLIMFLCHILYKKVKRPILYIKGTGKQSPKYLLYTENENVSKRMDNF